MEAKQLPSWASHLIVLAVATVLFSVFFGSLMWSPHERAPTFGGDGLTIHYNMHYHARHGDGAWLTSQYHPHAESIFMTDAQALVAVALAELRPWFPRLHEDAATVSNLLIFWSNPLAAWLLFLILRRLGVRWGIALIGGCLVAMMSPQILRQLGGQYTLGFTFLLPLILLYQLSYNHGRGYWWKSAGLALVITLIGLNNPYMYAVSAGLLMGAAGVGVLLRVFRATRLPWAQLIAWVAVTLVATAAILLILGRYDTVADRVEVPFGFFVNIATWGGLLTDPGLTTSAGVDLLLPDLSPRYTEDQLYLGLVPVLVILALAVALVVPKWRKAVFTTVPAPLLVLLVGVLPGLVLAFGMPFLLFREWTYEHLGSILQFRAPVRFGWPTYYVLGLLAVLAANWFYGRYRNSHAVWWLALPLALWATEANQFLNTHLDDHNHYNAFNRTVMAEQERLATSLGIDTATYSSIYLLPTENGWSDKVHQEGSWRSNHNGYQLSVATGLPLLNGKLSRLSLEWVLRSLQIVSHPLIERPLLDEIANDKDILLLASRENELAPQERAVLALADTLHDDGKMLLARLRPGDLRARTAAARRAALADTTATAPELRYAPEEDPTHAYAGAGSKRVPPMWTVVLKFPADMLRYDVDYELTAWVYADGSRFGGPKFFVQQFDANGGLLQQDDHWVNRSYDAHRGWLRTRVPFRRWGEAAEMVLLSEYEFPYWLDEVWVTEAGRPAKVLTDRELLFDGVRLQR